MEITEIDNKIIALTKLRSILILEANNVIEEVFIRYIQYRRVTEVAIYLNDKGYKIDGARGKRKYISDDITMILEDKDSENSVRYEIFKLASMVKKSKRLTDAMLLEL